MRASGSDPDWADRGGRAPAPLPLAINSRGAEEARVPAPGEIIAVSAPSSAVASSPIIVAGNTVPELSPGERDSLPEPDQWASERGGRPLLVSPVSALPPGWSPTAPLVPGRGPGPDMPVGRNWVQEPVAVPLPPPMMQPEMVPGFAGVEDGPLPRFYLSGEYLLWWARRDHVPPLFTTSEPQDGGFLDRPSTVLLFDGSLHRNPFSGARFTAGYWLDDCQKQGIEVSGFFLGQRSARGEFNSSQFPVLARPFLEFNRNTESSELVGFPGVFNGKGTVSAPSELWGIEANYRCCVCSTCDRQITGLAGFRYLNLKESITIVENVMGLPTAPAPLTNTNSTVFDSFATRNQFYGGQVGLESRWLRGNWSLDVRGKVALGATTQDLTIDGGQRVTNLTTGVTTTAVGGLLALPGANIGHYSRDAFSVVPEAGVTLGYQITNGIRATVGYNFLYWTSVLRPGDQIDRTLDITRIPNFVLPPGVTQRTDEVRPLVPFKSSDYWAQGLTFGLEFTW
jgi:hypothetical protein